MKGLTGFIMGRRIGLIVVGVMAGIGVIVAHPASAKVVSSGESTAISTGTVDDDLYISGQDVQIEGTVNGDVYAAGQTITVNGTVNGDVIAAGQTVKVSGKVASLRLAAQTVSLDRAEVGGGVSVFAQTFTVDSNSTIGRGLVVFGQAVTVKGPVKNSISGGAETLRIDSTVGREVNAGADSLVLGPAAAIGGNVNYQSESTIKQEAGSTVAGKVNRIEPKRDENRDESPLAEVLTWQLWAYTSALVIGLLLIWVFRPTMERVAATITNRPGASLGWGFISLLLAIPAFILLMITVVGIPLAIVGAIAYGLTLYLAKLFTAMALARTGLNPITDDRWRLPGGFAIALLAYYLLSLIPVVNVITVLGAMLAGVGGVVLAIATRNPVAPAADRGGARPAASNRR